MEQSGCNANADNNVDKANTPRFPKDWLNPDEVVSEALILKLNYLADMNQLADNDADQVIEILQQINAEYVMSIQNVRHTLLSLGVAPDQLSDGTRKLVKAACECNNSEAEVTFRNDRLKRARHVMEAASIKTSLNVVSKSNVDRKQQVASLETELGKVDRASEALQAKAKGANALKKAYTVKVEKCTAACSRYEKELSRSGIADTGMYQSMLDKFEEMAVVKSEVEKLSAKLEKYGNLQPNLDAAGEMLVQAKQEHDQLSQELKKIVDKDFKTFSKD